MAEKEGVAKEKPARSRMARTADAVSKAVMDKMLNLQTTLTKEVRKILTKKMGFIYIGFKEKYHESSVQDKEKII